MASVRGTPDHLNYALFVIQLFFGIMFLVFGIVNNNILKLIVGILEILVGVTIFTLIFILRRIKKKVLVDIENKVLDSYVILNDPPNMKCQKFIDFFEKLAEKHYFTAIILAISITLGLMANVTGIVFIFQEFPIIGFTLFFLPSIIAIPILIVVLVVRRRKAAHWYMLSSSEGDLH